MRTTLFALPLPLLLFLTTQTFALPAPTNPTLLESYLDFNLDQKTTIPGTFNANAHSLSKRDLNPQSPLNSNDESGKIAEACKPPHFQREEIDRLVGVLIGEMLSLHSHGIAFPYSANTHCSGTVELTARSPFPSSISPESVQAQPQFNAKLRIRLTPVGKDNYGMKRVHFASLLERVGSAWSGLGYEFIGSDSEGQSLKPENEDQGQSGERGQRDDGEGKRGVLEGVSGDVGFVAKLVVSPVLGSGCLV
ncbi:hypothetical protein DL98DRAFT_598787 [Cadophora sp. DSE1049]|nr:hypothetical protein DL98DRAFT_598787 [Cadophora sp. DSE1049]